MMTNEPNKIEELIQKALNENIANQNKMGSNIGKLAKDVEPYNNIHFLNMIDAVGEMLKTEPKHNSASDDDTTCKKDNKRDERDIMRDPLLPSTYNPNAR